MKFKLINGWAVRLAGIFLFVLGWSYFYTLPPLLTAEKERAAKVPSIKIESLSKQAGRAPWRVCYLGSNSFHHHALDIIRKLKNPPVLVLIDAHSDASPASEKLNCGNWVKYAQGENAIKKTIWLGGALGISMECVKWFSFESLSSGKMYPFPARGCRAYFKTDKRALCRFEYAKKEKNDSIGAFFGEPGVSVSWYNWREAFELGALKKIIEDNDIYISLDLDVLKKEVAPTVWGNGLMTMAELKEMLDYLKANFKITGMDICGPKEQGMEVLKYAERF
ncbi:MAG: arginase family protein [Elusimicrobiota bacterium]|nr:arginase family protein [Elusimicrobiota bacterium]